jgi:DNA-binding beta-propeller fold protein YncE
MSVLRRRLRLAAVAFAATTVMFAGWSVAQAVTEVHVVSSFDESRGQNTEGLAVDRDGNVFVSVSPLGDLWKIPADAAQPQPFGHVGGIVPGRDFGLLGLAVSASGDVFGAVQSADPGVNGVWRFDHRTGEARRLPGTAAIGIPNGLAFDRGGNLYVADSTGKIWRVRPGSRAKVWLEGEALTGNGSLGLFLGANGIAYRQHVFTVTNTERRTILRIPKVAGRPGPVSVLTTLPDGDNPDGVALDVEGNAYVAMNLADAVGRVSPSGSLAVLASGDPLDFPSSVAFGALPGERRKLFGVNFSIGEQFGQAPGFGPALWWLRAGERGAPLP